MGKVLIIALAAFSLSACARMGSFCEIADPHRFSDTVVDAMSDEEVNQELTHNEQGQKLCGWRP